MAHIFKPYKKIKEESIAILLFYSIAFHFIIALSVKQLKPGEPEVINIIVTTNTIQLSSTSKNTNRQSIQKMRDKILPTKELIKSKTQKQTKEKEIPSEKNIAPIAQPTIPNPTPVGQSANESKDFFLQNLQSTKQQCVHYLKLILQKTQQMPE